MFGFFKKIASPETIVSDTLDDEKTQNNMVNPKESHLVKKDEIIFDDEFKYETDLEYLTNMKVFSDKIFEASSVSNKKTTYIVNINKFDLLNIKPYRHQREANYEHINNLENGIKKTGYLYHPIILCNIPYRSELSIIDGQHRYQALQNIYKKDKEFNIDVMFEIITLEIENDSLIMDIYRNVNTCEAIDMKKIIKEKDYVDFIQKIKNKFGKSTIVDMKNHRKHYILEKDLKNELIKNDFLVKYETQTLFDKFIMLNERYRKMIETNIEKYNKNDVERCRKNNFWLGFERLDKLMTKF